MDDPSPLERLTEAGAVDIALSATIRPDVPSGDVTEMATDDTVLADSGDETAAPHRLPRITVDLRGTLSGEEEPDSRADLEVRRILGEGGMGRVFLARQHSLARDVAVKTTKDGAPRSAARALVFEGVICGQLEHPSIVPVHALGLDQAERPALIMKRIEGESWDVLLRDPTHVLWESWGGDEHDRLLGHLEIMMQVCNAVHFAHSRGIVHRDLKPENVLIGGFGDVYLADWGVAAHMDTPADERLCGTPGYMAPEMVRGDAVDARTDVYLLGAVLHEVLTGKLRHDAPTSHEALHAALISAPARYGPDVPPRLGQLANRACAVEPEDRPRNAKELRDAITGFLRHRASVQLAAKATERIDELDMLRAEADDRQADDWEHEDDRMRRRVIERLIVEARFGLEQALEEWPDNGEAHEAMKRLEHILDDRRARAEALERLAHERDPRVGQRQRTTALAIIACIALGISGLATNNDGAITKVQMLGYAAIVLIVLTVVTITLRRRLLRNAFGRQLMAVIVGTTLTMAIPRLVGLFVPVSVPDAFARDMFALAAATTVVAITLAREAAPMAAVALLSGMAIMIWPSAAVTIFGASTSAMFAIAAIASHCMTSESTRGLFT